jgi:L-rhamnose isomerase
MGLFLVEAMGLHFLVAIWSPVAAWVLTALSIYTCLQLAAHIRALRFRPIEVGAQQLYLRNGLLGGEVALPFNLIESVFCSTGNQVPPGAVHLSLLKSMEKHNVCIRLKEKITIIKAFGITRKADAILLHVDGPQTFIHAVQRSMG